MGSLKLAKNYLKLKRFIKIKNGMCTLSIFIIKRFIRNSYKNNFYLCEFALRLKSNKNLCDYGQIS